MLKIVTSAKDSVKMRWDLQCRAIRPHLWLTNNLWRGGKMLKLIAPYVLATTKFDSFVITIKNVKTPWGHVLAIKKHFKNKIFGILKSHDYHILMQQILLLIALQGFLVLKPRTKVMKISKVLRKVCNNVRNPFEIVSLQHDVAVCLALVEMCFPSSSF